MKVFVAGASGRVGKALVADLVSSGNEVVAASRGAEGLEWPEGVVPCRFDFHWTVDEMAERVAGCDAVYCVAGSRGKDLLQTDAFGAVKLMGAAKQVGAQRFVMLSSLFAMEPERWAQEPSLSGITDYNIAKLFADEWLTHRSGLAWTIVQPSILKEEPGTGRIELDPAHDGSNPIPDVAAVLAGVLDRPNTVGKVVMMRSGDTPVADALAEV
ncbi:NAD(P)H-binding protein [Caniella muris]|uniref:NAD(P)H-binding protein n=1 Tax=Caniella muris TaxID=2941502 RepID=UPI00203B71A9|nr:NAD(P)H-binding protein [Caniella muris]